MSHAIDMSPSTDMSTLVDVLSHRAEAQPHRRAFGFLRATGEWPRS